MSDSGWNRNLRVSLNPKLNLTLTLPPNTILNLTGSLVSEEGVFYKSTPAFIFTDDKKLFLFLSSAVNFGADFVANKRNSHFVRGAEKRPPTNNQTWTFQLFMGYFLLQGRIQCFLFTKFNFQIEIYTKIQWNTEFNLSQIFC